MNQFEARLEIHRRITLSLIDLVDSDGTMNDDEYREALESMEDVAELILESLDFNVTGATEEGGDTEVTATLLLRSQ